MAVLSLPVAQRDLVCAELLRDPLLVAVHEDRPLAGESVIAPKDLRRERVLLMRDGHCVRGDMLTVCRRARVDPGTVFETDQFASIFALVSAGFGVSVVPQMAAGGAGGCRLLPLAPPIARRIGYAHVRSEFVPPAQTAFIRWLKQATRG